MRFADYGKRVVFAAFDGGEITSDAGVLLLREQARRIHLSRISHQRIVWSLIIYCKQTVIEIFGKRQKYRVFFRSGPFFVRRREGLHGFGEPLQGAPCRRPVFPVLQHIDDRLVG